jgi:DNA-binding transcriptional LysR family regulator
LRINASLPFGTLHVAPAIPAFLQRHPDLTIDLSLTDDVVNLLEQKADIAIRMGALPDSALVARKLGQSRRVVCASPDYLARKGTPQTPDDLLHHDCIRFNFRRSSTHWLFRQGGEDRPLPVTGNLLVNNGGTAKQLAIAGAGVARLAVFHVAADIASGALVPVLEAYNPGDVELIHAIYVGGGPVPSRVRVFIDYMADVLAKSPLHS